MASHHVLAFNLEGRPIHFDTWLDDLQLYLLSNSRDSVSLFDHTSGTAPTPPATADSRVLLPYLFPELSTFATVEDLVSHLRACDARYRAAAPAEEHFLSLDPTSLTVDLLEQHLLAAETSAVAVGAVCGTLRTHFFEGCSPSPLTPSYASTAAVDVPGAEDVGAASPSVKRRSSKGKGGRGGGGGSENGGGGRSGGSGGSAGGGSGGSGGGNVGVGGGGGGGGGSGGSGSGGSGGGRTGAQRGGSRGGQRQRQQRRSETLSPEQLHYDANQSAMYAMCASAEGDCYRCVPPDLGIEATALGASESSLPNTAPAEALHTFTLDSGASRCFFRDSTTLTPLPAPVPVRLADPSGGPVVARSSTIIPCPVLPSGSLTGLHLPSFSTNLVSASGLVAPPCSCRLLSHLTLLWHHRLGHPSLSRLRGMHSRLLVSGLPRSLPPLPPSPAPPCLPCVEGRQRAAPHSSSFPLTTDPLQTLHMDSILHSFTLPASPQQNGIAGRCIGFVMEVARTSMIHAAAPHFLWPFAVRYAAHQLNLWPRVSLPETSPTLRWTGQVGEASMFQVLRSLLPPHLAPCHPLTFDDSNPFYRLFPYRSAPPPPPTLFLTPGPPSEDPLPPHVPAFSAGGADPEGAGSRGAEPGGAEPGGAEPVGAEPGGAEPEGVELWGAKSEGAESGGVEPQGAASSGGLAGSLPRLSPRPEPLSPQQLCEWLVRRARLRSGAAGAGAVRHTGAGGAGVTTGARGTRGTAAAGPGGAHTGGIGAAGTGGVGGAGAGDPTKLGAAEAGGTGAGDTGAGGTGAGEAGAGGTGAEGAGAGGAGAGGTRAGGAGAGGAGAGRTGTRGAGAGGARAIDPGATGTGTEGNMRPRSYFLPLLQQVLSVRSSTSLTPPLLYPPPDQSQPPLQLASPLPAPSPYTEQSSGLTEHREPASRPVSPVPRSCPPLVPGMHPMVLRPSSVPLRVPLLPPLESSLPAVLNPESDRSRAASPTIPRLIATVVTNPSFESTAASALVAKLLDFSAACRLDYATALVAEFESEDFECLTAAVPRLASMLLAPKGDPDAPNIPTQRSYAEAIMGPYSSQWQAAMDAEMAFWKSKGTYVDALPPSRENIVDGMWFFRVKWPPGSPPAFKTRYVARGFNQRQGVDYFENFSPTLKMTTLWVLLHVAPQRDYELHSLDFITVFLQGSLHKEIWLRRPPGFTGSFPAGTQWILQGPVYGLPQAPCEWHNTLRTTLAALGFTPSTAGPSLFLRINTSLPPFYVLVYDHDLAFATADTEDLAKSELQKRHTCTNLGELRSYLGLQITRVRAWRTITLTQSHMVHQVLQRFGFQFSSPQPTPPSTSHSLSAPPSNKSVEPSVPYPKLVGCLMYLMTCTRPDLAYPVSLLARYVAPGRHRKRTSQGSTFILGSCSVSWWSTRSSSVLSFSCEAEIYAGAMAAQGLRWLTYLQTDLGEQPRSPPVLYVDNKAMIALCQEHRLEHRTKHIALQYFLSRELQQHGQLRLANVATRANTADIFTMALPLGDHQRFSTVLGLVPTLPHLLTT
ncbi:unnamed protein product [Closterium sp. NIES-53]